MFADPQSLTINAVATSMPLITRVGQESKYRSADGVHVLKIQHQEGGRYRRVVRLDNTKYAAHPTTGLQTQVSTSVYLVADVSPFGYTDAEVTYLVDALKTWLTSTNVGRLLDGES